MTKRITMLSPIQGGTAYGLLTIAGSPYTVDDALAAELVNRGVALFTDPPAPTSVYATFVTYMTAAQFAQVAMGAAGVTYEITDVGGRPQYRWNGSAFVSIGTGGGGATTPSPIAVTAVVPLDLADPGKVMTTDGNAPNGANERIPVTANTVLAVGARVLNGATSAVYSTDGTHTLDVSAFNPQAGKDLLVNGIFTGAAGRLYGFLFASPASSPALPQVGIQDLGPLDQAAPTIASIVVANATPGVLNFTTSEPIKSPMPTNMPFAVSAGHPLTGVPVYVDSTHFNVATSTPFVSGEAPRTMGYTVAPVNPIQDIAGNNLAAFGGLAITNNVLVASRADNFQGAAVNPPSDGGSNWVDETGGGYTGSSLKLSGPKRIGRGNGLYLVTMLQTNRLLQDQTWTVNPGAINVGTVDSDSVYFRYSQGGANLIALVFRADTARIDTFVLVAGTGVFTASKTNILNGNVANTVRGYIVANGPNFDFMVDVNGVNVPELTYPSISAALTGTFIAINLSQLEPQQTLITNLA